MGWILRRHSDVHIPCRADDTPIARRGTNVASWIRMRARGLLIVAIACFAAAVLTLLAYLDSSFGRERAARWLEARMSAAIPGSVSIGAIDSLKPSAVRVRDLAFLDPHGNAVLRAEHARIDLDLSAALHGQLGFDSARVDGGELVLAVQPDGRTSLEAAFSEPSTAPPDPERGLQCRLRDIVVNDLKVVIQLSKDKAFTFQDVAAVLRIWRQHTPGMRVEMNGISGHLAKPKLLGSRVTLVRADGAVRGAEPHVLHMSFATRLQNGDAHDKGADDDGRIDGHLDYYYHGKTPVKIELYPRGDLKAHLATAFVDLQSWLTDEVVVNVH
ncbi:MAG TPA: hypothetical protein VHM19_03800 [Polyangiales bacterium]|jgi:hypothetical protein|nr:hypothetical protein [Polyangiales bacterium]